MAGQIRDDVTGSVREPDIELGDGIVLVNPLGQMWYWVCTRCDAFSPLMIQGDAETRAIEHSAGCEGVSHER